MHNPMTTKTIPRRRNTIKEPIETIHLCLCLADENLFKITIATAFVKFLTVGLWDHKN
jgi:hypothetical protein